MVSEGSTSRVMVLNLGLYVLNGVRGLDVQGDGVAGQGLHEDLHAATETKHKMKSGLLLDVVVRKGTAILKLLASKDEALLVRRDALFVLNLGLYVLNGVRGLDVQGDGLAG